NVLIDRKRQDEHAYLTDFGLTTALNEASAEGGTVQGMVAGTPDYMAPEQAVDARSVDIRADIYSLGCVLFHALAGQPPFPDANVVSQMIRHASEAIPPLRQFNAEVPDGLQQVLGWLMAKDPAQRYATPERAAQALQVFLTNALEQDAVLEIPAPMRTYLNWLESTESAPATAQPARQTARGMRDPSAASGRIAEGPRTPEAKKAIPIGKPEGTGRVSRQTSERPEPRRPADPAPAPAGPIPATDAYDVELVAAEADGEPRDKYQLTRRDFVMIAVGAGGVLITVLIGWLLAHLFGRRDKESPEDGAKGR
ncbi:MAG TPA: protein kinase, partial [Gemmataceae bacterium]|nr:protein kinase [Gemmataceae bacterium]